ncbi:helix-turn-helix domain-containing protein [Bartonella henselae]|uniref:DNA-binding protein n=3 Tax=Bartonella TaxID=773 RepID=A0A0H3LXL1_BARHE|nr:helix-turn-helix transcriptional regulator [Bartonella henselae]ATP12742.1 transcriptional regulator [Bartonella henselae]MDM9983280.1 helix-turn-helix transcriptional regulator [Bartonella henselae]MDM9985159.1 helix-turn-helix transcriptional regulator [Bartonella henselae]MDM9986435.1 helix-turn-helix transcriptional regulator [Bartonella henselae]MDM9988190.1 helix-turn-helix transcriptional regulator [Bartonella henselae]
MRTKNPHFNDISVGKKIRFRRSIMGLSQKQLGSHLGITFQQIQKYEKGINRVSAGRLQEIADRLDVPVSFFYADISKKEDTLYPDNDRISNKAEHLLLKNFRGLNPKKQRAILRLISD